MIHFSILSLCILLFHYIYYFSSIARIHVILENLATLNEVASTIDGILPLPACNKKWILDSPILLIM